MAEGGSCAIVCVCVCVLFSNIWLAALEAGVAVVHRTDWMEWVIGWLRAVLGLRRC